MNNTTHPNQLPPHFIVIEPGFMGSRLRDKNTGEIVWIDFPGLLSNPLRTGEAIDTLLQKMTYPNDALEPAGLVDEVIFVPRSLSKSSITVSLKN